MLDFLAISAAGKAFQGAANLVRELKRPRVRQKDFSAMLHQQMQQRAAESNGDADVKRAAALREVFVKHRDADGNGRISLGESGLDTKAFKAADRNEDGELCADELQAWLLTQIQAARPKGTGHE